jgi:hypothetical protein
MIRNLHEKDAGQLSCKPSGQLTIRAGSRRRGPPERRGGDHVGSDSGSCTASTAKRAAFIFAKDSTTHRALCMQFEKNGLQTLSGFGPRPD